VCIRIRTIEHGIPLAPNGQTSHSGNLDVPERPPAGLDEPVVARGNGHDGSRTDFPRRVDHTLDRRPIVAAPISPRAEIADIQDLPDGSDRPGKCDGAERKAKCRNSTGSI
jgi:hypothetical protein